MPAKRPLCACYLAVALIVFTGSLATSAGAQTETVLYDFTGQSDGSVPLAGLVFDSAGNLYGTAGSAVFELSPTTGGGWTHNTILTMTEGRTPQSGLIFDTSGNLYGTTIAGGIGINCNDNEGCGIVYELSPSSSGWVETVLYQFTGSTDGGSPAGNLVFDTSGNLYGTTEYGGDSECYGGLGCGTVFELSPTSSGWKESVLHAFADKADGALPLGGVILDAAGNLYGTTYLGGNIKDCHGPINGCGVVFQLTPTSTGWTEHVLHSFTGANGWAPAAGLTLDSTGNLYGTTFTGGGVFKLTPTASGPWRYSMLKLLQGRGGSNSEAALTFDSSGNLYGTTDYGGDLTDCNSFGCGVVFELSPTTSGPWKETLLHAFTGGADGNDAISDVILDETGNLYGVTAGGGNLSDCNSYGCGVVYKIRP
jgi:uncharacterized repeat protein (TIGR03803 family)